MPTKAEQDWSDSDSDYGPSSGVETSVQLGIPDGSISSQVDLRDPCVSKIGGPPAFVMSYHPDVSCSQCKNCSTLMQMLVQVWCPLEESPMDRTIYVWACPKWSCQRKDGSIRAWRGLRLNEKYAAKLAKQAARKEQEKKTIKDAALKSTVKTNPFSLTGGHTLNLPGLGSLIFEGAPVYGAVVPDVSANDVVESDSEEADDDNECDDLAEALASTTLDGRSPWSTTPSYPPLYLSTISEYLPPPPKLKPIHIDDPLADGETKDKRSLSLLEAYENSLNVDEVFSRFTTRVAHEGQQCIRYELKGTPLPFASDAVLDKLFPTLKSQIVAVTKNALMAQPPTAKRTFSTDSIPLCQKCQSSRIFEFQLMPNLINAVRSTAVPTKDVSDEERKRELEKELKNKSGMEWGTCMIFSCELNCCSTGKEGWVEEYVVVQWE